MSKADFPIFDMPINGKKLVYLDTAASAQKPSNVLETMRVFSERHYANVHRGAYFLSETATIAFEESRRKVAGFLNARENDIIFTRGATDSINLVAGTFGKTLKKGDEIILSIAEHHSNMIPWQMLRDERGIVLRFIDVDDAGHLDMKTFEKALSDKTKLVAITQMSNVLGISFPVKDIVAKAHAVGAKVLVDGCQAIVHTQTDVKDMGCDFYVFSGHKLYGPTGIGILYAPYELMNTLPPLQGGGDMVESVTLEKTLYTLSPARFEAGTPSIVEAIGLSAAVDYIMNHSNLHEKKLMNDLCYGLEEVGGITPLGVCDNKESLICFNIDGVHPQDAAFILDSMGVCVRVGHHCAQPITERFNVTASIRASVGIYNDDEDIDTFIRAVKKAKEMLS